MLNCVKITPNDIGLLDMNNWKLGINSFLTHGYYSYRYILLGRLVFDQNNMNDKRYVIGVPGIYSSREKYLADIFGFGRFIMADKMTERPAGSVTGSQMWLCDRRSIHERGNIRYGR